MKVLAEELQQGDILAGKGAVVNVTLARRGEADRVIVCLEHDKGQTVVKYDPHERIEVMSL